MNLTFVDQFYIIKIDGASKVRDKKLTKFSPLLHLKYIKHYFHYSWWKDKHLHNRLGRKVFQVLYRPFLGMILLHPNYS